MGIRQCNDDATDLNDVDLGRMWGTLKENAGCYDYPADCSEQPCQHGGTCSEGPDGCEELNVEQEDVMVDLLFHLLVQCCSIKLMAELHCVF